MNVIRKNITLKPDPKRVLFRPFTPKTEKEALDTISRILLLPEDKVTEQLNNVISEFGDRHQQINNFLMRRYNEVKDLIFTDIKLSKERQLLIGSYFTMEYSFESAALFNPSLIWFPGTTQQSGKSRKFILSLRAVGEGHVSSLTFRSGEITSNREIKIDSCKKFVTSPEFIPDKLYEKTLFIRKLHELGFTGDFTTKVLLGLKKTFTFSELNNSINYALREYSNKRGDNEFLANKIILLARSNYEVVFNENQDISERVIFPSTPNEINGIEDARFTAFKEDDGSITYYATYTAYDGEATLPQLLETKDFLHFKISTLNGPEVYNKGMALFPRKINGHYAMLSRQDGENIFIMFSDMIHFWYTKQILLRPTYEWEFTKIGNCGSPIETDDGWLVLSHGVGPMRKYSIGAFLLDKDDPLKVIGRTKEPILTANENEREGYVPNVVYSCGGKIFNGDLIIPYAMSDYASSFAIVNLKELIAEIKSN